MTYVFDTENKRMIKEEITRLKKSYMKSIHGRRYQMESTKNTCGR
jgi:hypothetical protein